MVKQTSALGLEDCHTLYKDPWKFLQFQFWFYNNQDALYQNLILSYYICMQISSAASFLSQVQMYTMGRPLEQL